MINPEDGLLLPGAEPLRHQDILEQLERLIESRHFRNSRRYPAFLRYVVEKTVQSSGMEALKERTLGIDVFARASDYDTNADPVVRVTAGEIRKRLAQYYQEPGHNQEIRILLPVGSYVPHFLGPEHPIALLQEEQETALELGHEPSMPGPVNALNSPAVKPARSFGWRFRLTLLLAVLLLAGGVAGWSLWHNRAGRPGIEGLWQPILSSPMPALVLIGVHSLDSQGNEKEVDSHQAGEAPGSMLAEMVRSDMVPVTDIVSYSRLTDVLTRHGHAYATLGSADASLEQVRRGPLILVGGLDNFWTLRLTSRLRFHFQASDHTKSSIVDSQSPGHRWTFDNLQKPVGSGQDYALVASYNDDSIDQPVLVVAGIGSAGTLVASEFLTSSQELQGWVRQAHARGMHNVELVLETSVLDGKPGPPHVVDSAVW